MQNEQVRALFRHFAEGYARRDLSQLERFMELFVSSGTLEVVGTNAVQPGEGEWCLGTEATRQLVANDWEHWGDVVFDVDGARVSAQGDVAWLATTGTVTDIIPAEQRYNGYLQYVQGILKDQERGFEAKALDIVRLGNDIVVDLPLGETFVWPFRFSAVAVREEGQWRFHQMHFSFATTRAPDVRTVA